MKVFWPHYDAKNIVFAKQYCYYAKPYKSFFSMNVSCRESATWTLFSGRWHRRCDWLPNADQWQRTDIITWVGASVAWMESEQQRGRRCWRRHYPPCYATLLQSQPTAQLHSDVWRRFCRSLRYFCRVRNLDLMLPVRWRHSTSGSRRQSPSRWIIGRSSSHVDKRLIGWCH